jgi:hypothetical protein
MTTHPATIQDVAQGPALAVALCGAHYNGRQETVSGPALILFTDPVTHSTIGLPENEVTVGNVWRALRAKRDEYRAAMLETTSPRETP